MPTIRLPGLGRQDIGALVRFVIAGGANTVFSYLVYLALNVWLPYWAAYTIGYVAGIALSYVVNRHFVFRAGASVAGTLAFPVVYLGQWALGLVIVWFWVDVLAWTDTVAPLVASAITVPLTFTLIRRIFRHPLRPAAAPTGPLDQPSHPGASGETR